MGIFGSDDFNLETAQAIHRNIVKVPEHHFEQIEPSPILAKYLRGAHCIGLVRADGYVSVTGLKSGIKFRWLIDLGLVVEK